MVWATDAGSKAQKLVCDFCPATTKESFESLNEAVEGARACFDKTPNGRHSTYAPVR